ncbi:type VI secretion system tip protein VgrG [Neisseriaceae bacterium PsAf]|nr:type VI secretion system tip protein VgrG [Neisseriaceae bacterium PsAf]
MLINIKNSQLEAYEAYPLSFETHEGLSVCSNYHLAFQSPNPSIDIEKLLGKLVEVSIEKPDKSGYRYFYAYIVGGIDTGQLGEHYTYDLELSPWLWFLTQNRNSKIYQHVDVIEIIKDVFSRYSSSNYKINVQSKYPKRNYCVQFNESDFNFVTRLLQFEGIWYYFEHKNGKHTLIITDKQDFPALEGGYSKIDFVPDGEEHRSIGEAIQKVNRVNKVRPNQVILRDFDYLEPKKDLHVNVENQETLKITGTPLEWYDYSQNYLDPDRGNSLAKIRLEEMTANTNMLSGEGNLVGMVPGHSFSLKRHPNSKKNTKYKVIKADYVFLQDGPDSSNSVGRNIVCNFQVLDASIPFRPIQTSSKPKVPGIHSATVVGPVKSEVHTDRHGRIRVHFHWDRYKKTEEDSSCWIRVVQAWGGKGWGVVSMPRVGQEVLVAYMDGDIDRPLVIGNVYNGDNPPPYELPKHINYSGMVSRSLKFGVPANANLFTMDDKRDNERIMIHAERDFQGVTERNDAKFVGQDLYEVVKRVSTKFLTSHFKFTDYAFSATGVSNSFTGVSTSSVGVSVSSTGKSVSFVGDSTSFTGNSASFTGNSTSFTGNSTSFTGNSTSFTGKSTSMVGRSDSFVGSSSSVVGMSQSYTGSSESTTGSSRSVTGSSISTVGSSMSTVGCAVSVTGSSMSKVGSVCSVTGCSVSTTGKSVSTTGKSISTTGSSVSTTGSSVSTTGSSMSTTCMSKSKVGVSISFVGVSIHKTGVDIKL